jgi:hypothetical protein
MQRSTPRVILRHPRRGRFGDEEVLVLEMGLGGAKFEHGTRLAVGSTATFSCGPLTTAGSVRHSVLLPAKTGVVYQSGIAFSGIGERERDLLLELLLHEAEQQVREWEANLRGDAAPRAARKPARQSAVVRRFVCLRHTHAGWMRVITADPNQPVDGITILESTPEEEVAILRRSYERADEQTREFMRQVATLEILEGMRGG